MRPRIDSFRVMLFFMVMILLILNASIALWTGSISNKLNKLDTLSEDIHQHLDVLAPLDSNGNLITATQYEPDNYHVVAYEGKPIPSLSADNHVCYNPEDHSDCDGGCICDGLGCNQSDYNTAEYRIKLVRSTRKPNDITTVLILDHNRLIGNIMRLPHDRLYECLDKDNE